MPESKTPPEPIRVSASNTGVPAATVATPTGPGTEGTISGTIVKVEREHIWLDIGGDPAKIYASELMLDIGEQPADRYALGQTFSAFVFQMAPHPDSGAAQYSIRRAADYLERLATLKEGSVVIGTVVQTYDVGIEIDVNGLRGNCAGVEVGLPVGQLPHNHVKPGDTTEVFVWQIDYGERSLALSVRRNAPGYLDGLDAHSVGDIVTGTITAVGSSGIWVLTNGVLGGISAPEMPLADGQVPADLYSVGDYLSRLFVWQIDHGERSLALSVRRNMPGYLGGGLAVRSVGDVVTGTITAVGSGGVWVLVNGVLGAIGSPELPLEDGQVPTELYSVGDQISARVWSINYDDRSLSLSIRRATPGYDEALAAFEISDIVIGYITFVDVDFIALSLGVDGVVGFIHGFELLLAEGEVPADSYCTGQQLKALVWDIDLVGGHLYLSVRRLESGFVEAPSPVGTQLDAIVENTQQGGIEVRTTHGKAFIPGHELSLSIGSRPSFEIGQHIPVIVVAVDDDGKPAILSHRRALDDWEREAKRFERGTLIQDAQVIPLAALPEGAQRAAIDLGPITGFISDNELTYTQALDLMSHLSNTQYPVMVESLDDNNGSAIVSHQNFGDRWDKLATQFNEGSEIDAELREINPSLAYIDLKSGLLATIPSTQITLSGEDGKPSSDLIGKFIPVRVTKINGAEFHIAVEHRDQWLETLIGEPESQTLEFKEVLKGDKATKDAKEIIRKIIGTICAFLNTDGGKLVIGIHDASREVGGLEADQGLEGETIKEKIDNATQILERNLRNCEPVNRLEEFDLGTVVTWATTAVRGKTVLVITCDRGPKSGVFSRIVKSKLQFWARKGASTVPLLDRDEWIDHLQQREQRAAKESASP